MSLSQPSAHLIRPRTLFKIESRLQERRVVMHEVGSSAPVNCPKSPTRYFQGASFVAGIDHHCLHVHMQRFNERDTKMIGTARLAQHITEMTAVKDSTCNSVEQPWPGSIQGISISFLRDISAGNATYKHRVISHLLLLLLCSPAQLQLFLVYLGRMPLEDKEKTQSTARCQGQGDPRTNDYSYHQVSTQVCRLHVMRSHKF